MKNFFLFFTLLGVAVACDDENGNVTPLKTTLLTVQVDAMYTTDKTDNWIVVHSEDGELLSFESFESNSVAVLETDKPVDGNITTTQIRRTTSNNGFSWYTVESHTNVEKGKTIVYANTSTSPLGITGEVNVSVSDVASIEQYTLTSRIGTAVSARWSGGTNLLEINSVTHAGINKYILSVDDGSSLKYKTFDNVKANDNYNLSFLDMSPFDETVIFNFPTSDNFVMYVTGSDPDPNLYPNGYHLANYFSSDARSSARAGYLNSLINYRTRLSVTYPDYGLEYVNYGSIPDPDIVWPVKSDFSITTSAINNYKASTKKSFVWRASTWNYQDSQNYVNWNVYGSNDQQIIGELPTEIVSEHPVLGLSKMTHSSSIFYTQAMSYEDFVDSDFAGEIEVPGSRLGIKIIGN